MSTSTIVFNRNNIVCNGYNNTLKFNFSGNAVNFKSQEICISNIQIYNSTFNIIQTYKTIIRLVFWCPQQQHIKRYRSIYQNSYFEYADISNFITQQLILAGAYLIDAQGNNIDLLATPTSLPTGYTRPATGLHSSGGTGLPTATNTPKIVLSGSFCSVVGFAAGTYPSITQTTNQSFLSTTTPQINPVSSYLVRCNLINNKAMQPPDILTSFSTQGTKVGQLISISYPEYAWISVADGCYYNITLTITDQDFNYVKFEDTSMLITLLIRDKTQ
ncbi:TPA: hypothetical protein N0F65_001470 [Lagenidium giganteum]|uniref:Uncharacterized protein n=1 Tax=Lagenidium giganteum TaxID=4803 RepID=A0AAV2YLR9_9STRA|nr:TPA: hypothetical protein N0F65_001470 [Lagenidium giganteum]